MATLDGLGWTIALEFDLLRLEKRIDAVVLTDRAILCLEFKTARARAPPRWPRRRITRSTCAISMPAAAGHGIVPVLVAGGGGWTPPAQPWLLPKHPTDPLVCGAAGLAR